MHWAAAPVSKWLHRTERCQRVSGDRCHGKAGTPRSIGRDCTGVTGHPVRHVNGRDNEIIRRLHATEFRRNWPHSKAVLEDRRMSGDTGLNGTTTAETTGKEDRTYCPTVCFPCGLVYKNIYVIIFQGSTTMNGGLGPMPR